MVASLESASDAAPRLEQLRDWVAAQLRADVVALAPASSDASFRRYFRVTLNDRSYIVMDAPPPQENCAPFVHIAALLGAAGVHVPVVHAKDLARGFLLLSDLGDTTYLRKLKTHPEAAARHADPSDATDSLYRDAMSALVTLQSASRPGVLPDYDRALLERELRLFPDWYVKEQLRQTLQPRQQEILDASFEVILRNNLAQPQVYVHRDYHSRNLMVCHPNPGVLDFQDAVYGPITYDLASLLRDAYIEWEEERVIDWCVRYWEAARRAALPVPGDFGHFYRDFEWMGAQRQLKVIGIFARLAFRDGKQAYLEDQPLVMRYLKNTARRYGELNALARLLDELAPDVGVPRQ